MRKVLVTAGASGIGKEIAAAFLAAGDSVYTCDINRAALDAAAHELPGLKTGLCDVGDRKQIETMMADAVSQLGGIDILVNNAGISGPTAPVQDFDPDKWEAVLKVCRMKTARSSARERCRIASFMTCSSTEPARQPEFDGFREGNSSSVRF
jgi:NAD(P)-dependent dehydrogenase (short-subunit alcohol dehydrogenase family)